MNINNLFRNFKNNKILHPDHGKENRKDLLKILNNNEKYKIVIFETENLEKSAVTGTKLISSFEDCGLSLARRRRKF